VLELFDLGQERPVPERHDSGVSELELLRHAGRELSPMLVLVSHGLTVALRRLRDLPPAARRLHGAPKITAALGQT
jgi:hypothetical protein